MNEQFTVNMPYIYAISDVIKGGGMLAHKAKKKEHFPGSKSDEWRKTHTDYNLIMGCLYLAEIAAVGKTRRAVERGKGEL